MNSQITQSYQFYLDVSTEELHTMLDDYEQRWASTFEEVKNQPIEPDGFSKLIDTYIEETIEFINIITHYKNSDCDFKKNKMKFRKISNKLHMLLRKAEAISISKWKDKHPSLISQIILIFARKVQPFPSLPDKL